MDSNPPKTVTFPYLMAPKIKSNNLRLFGLRVRELRKLAELSQEKLAELSGLDRSYLGGIERGEHNLALLNIIKLSKALGASPSELLQCFSEENEY